MTPELARLVQQCAWFRQQTQGALMVLTSDLHDTHGCAGQLPGGVQRSRDGTCEPRGAVDAPAADRCCSGQGVRRVSRSLHNRTWTVSLLNCSLSPAPFAATAIDGGVLKSKRRNKRHIRKDQSRTRETVQSVREFTHCTSFFAHQSHHRLG